MDSIKSGTLKMNRMIESRNSLISFLKNNGDRPLNSETIERLLKSNWVDSVDQLVSQLQSKISHIRKNRDLMENAIDKISRKLGMIHLMSSIAEAAPDVWSKKVTEFFGKKMNEMEYKNYGYFPG